MAQSEQFHNSNEQSENTEIIKPLSPRDKLTARIERLYADFKEGLKDLSKDELIKQSSLIHAYSDAWSYTTMHYNFSDDEVELFSQFQNPLQVIAEQWQERNIDVGDVYDIIEYVNESQGKFLSKYPTIADAEPIPEPQQLDSTGDFKPGDWVIVRPDDAYGCLVGQVSAVDKIGSDAHDTDNPGDDIHVNFTALEYSDSAKADFLEAFDGYFPNASSFDELPLDDVIMAPESLISLAQLEFDEIDKLSVDYKAARDFCRHAMTDQLIARVEQNYADYNKSILTFDKPQIVEMAAAIHAYSDAWSYMTSYHEYSDEELQFYLQFDCPLEIVADEWRERNIDVGDLEFGMNFIIEHKLRYLPSVEAEPEKAEKEKSAFERGLERGKAKSEAYKTAEKPNKNRQEERN